MSNKIRAIGDIHQNTSTYLNIIKDCERSIQLGDLGFNYKFLDKVDSKKHQFIFGNHENFNILKNNPPPHLLPDYGTHPEFPSIFLCSGAWSIDQKFRREGIDWWPDEELSYRSLQDLIAAYDTARPEIVLSHQTADNIVPLMGLDPNFAFRMGHGQAYPPTRTGLALNECLRIHRPKLWIFNHYHHDFDQTIDGTRFICLTADPNLDRKQRYFDIEI